MSACRRRSKQLRNLLTFCYLHESKKQWEFAVLFYLTIGDKKALAAAE
jgi:hypothetical protein